MGSIQGKSYRSRALLFEFLQVDCGFLICTKEDCPLWEVRKRLSIEKNYEYVMRLSAEEIKSILAQYDCCCEKRLSDLNSW